ncbi:MAG: hypothetical protein IIT45_02045 [Treponema sp.]|nr:hypothetical protein [Treponema sp.]MBQ5569216.1 hypothetical protein [Treponema sp.]
MIFLQIVAPIAFIASWVFVTKAAFEYNRKYKRMVDFLRLEGDNETLKAIGYVEFYGEEYGLRKNFSITDACLRLYTRYEESNKNEYFEYAEYLEKNKKDTIRHILMIFGSFALLCIAFGKI